MASLLRTVAKQGCRILSSGSVKQRLLTPQACFISTSKKHKDSATVSEAVQDSPVTTEVKDENDPNWISYGYSYTDRDDDEWQHKMYMFFGITLCICGGGFIIAYMPDHRLRDWSHREAYLEIARRQREGLPLVDPNLIPTERIASQLPSDEELGDTEIIV